MLSSTDILEFFKTNKEEISQRFSVRRIGLFGSYLYGEADEHSYVDVLVDMDKPTFDHYMELKFYLEDHFHKPVDLVLVETVKPRLKPYITHRVVYA